MGLKTKDSANTNTSGNKNSKFFNSGLTLNRRVRLPPQFQNITLKFMFLLLTTCNLEVWSALGIWFKKS